MCCPVCVILTRDPSVILVKIHYSVCLIDPCKYWLFSFCVILGKLTTVFSWCYPSEYFDFLACVILTNIVLILTIVSISDPCEYWLFSFCIICMVIIWSVCKIPTMVANHSNQYDMYNYLDGTICIDPDD